MTGLWQCLANLWKIAGREYAGRVMVRCLIGGVRIASSLAFV